MELEQLQMDEKSIARREYYAINQARIRARDNETARRRKTQQEKSGAKPAQKPTQHTPRRKRTFRSNPDFYKIVAAIREEDEAALAAQRNAEKAAAMREIQESELAAAKAHQGRGGEKQ